jgi:hypothetical protein
MGRSRFDERAAVDHAFMVMRSPLLPLAVVVLGATGASGCYQWTGAYDEGSALIHPSMTPDDVSCAIDRKVRAQTEGSAPTEASLINR